MKKIQDLKENEVIHCQTEEQAKEICKMMHELGMTWKDGTSYLNNECYSYFKYSTAYCPKKGTHGRVVYFSQNDYIIHKATDFLNKKNDMKGKFIKVLSEEHGRKVIEFFKSKGVDTQYCRCSKAGFFYGVSSNGFFDVSLHLPEYAELIELPNENVYPKVMMVSDEPLNFENKGIKRVVFAEKKGIFITWINATTFEEAEEELTSTYWKCAKDIDDPIFQVKKMTQEEIEKELGYKIEIV